MKISIKLPRFRQGFIDRLGKPTLALLLGMATSMPGFADDTEIYVGRAGVAGTASNNPNVLIVIDTSGSMFDEVITQTDYDPTVVYDGCFDANQVYFSGSSMPSNCGTRQAFPTTMLKCDAAFSLDTVGLYQDRFVIYDTRIRNFAFPRWTPLGSFVYDPRHVECLEDVGQHGETDGSPDVYPKGGFPISGGQIWTALPEQKVDPLFFSTVTTLYTGNFLNYTRSADVGFKSRLETVQQVLLTLLDGMTGVNVGLMRFDTRSEGGPVTYHVQDIGAHRNNLKAEMLTYSPGGGTPLSETLYEAVQYMSGGEITFGKNSVPGLAGEATMPGNLNYRSPIVSQCQSNNIILLTDGEPTSDVSANDLVPTLPRFSEVTGKAACANDHPDEFNPGNLSGICLDEIAGYMRNADLAPGIDGAQNVTTFTVGFQLDHPLLTATSESGGGRHYRADDAVQLTTAFTNIFTDIRTQSTSFTAPAVSVNAFNRTTHREELFFTLFKPAAAPHWDGNLKKYRIGELNGEPAILDQNGRQAVDVDTGFFADSALSFWTDPQTLPDNSASDGGDVTKGGAASRLPAERKIYTYTGAGAPANVNLTDASNRLHENNAAVTAELLAMDPAGIPDRATLLKWARGLDVDGRFGAPDGPRPIMGDPLHSRPVVVQYGGTENNPDLTVYVTTNDGYLHAFDQDTGEELFAFVPQVMLDNLLPLYTNTASGSRPYGLDGTISVWEHDENSDGVINTAQGDRIRLFFGMRRGGGNYYAMDVTDRDNPRLMWRIEAGQPGFEELGQTWSEPVVAKVNYDGDPKTVLVFGGGYDIAQDSNNVRRDDTVGRAIYVVDAETGERLWWAGPAGSGADLVLAEMTNSIPSRVAVIDVDGDSLSDLMYVGDMAAQLWRFDIDNLNDAGIKIAGGRIAELSTRASVANNRRFYYPPDVSYQLDSGFPSYLAIGIGSGYRAHPLDTEVEDRIYMLRDTDVFTPPEEYVTLTEADLFDATDNVIGEGNVDSVQAARVELADQQGWYIVLREPGGGFVGEKVLAEVQLVANIMTVSTFAPVAGRDPCSPDDGRGAVYFLNIADATPSNEFDQIDGRTRADRRVLLKRGGIPPSPTLVITADTTVNLVGPEIVDDPTQRQIYKTYWQQR